MASTFQNPRLAALPCERMSSCNFAENFVTLATVADNHGTLGGTGHAADHGLTTDGNGYVYFDIQPQPGNFSAVIKFKASEMADSDKLLVGNNDATSGGFDIFATTTGVKAEVSDGTNTATLSIEMDYSDGDSHTITYLAIRGILHGLLVDADLSDSGTGIQSLNPGSIGSTTEIHTAGQAGVSSTYFVGSIECVRVFDQFLDPLDHAAYVTDTMEGFADAPFAVYRCDSFCNDTDGHKIWDRGLQLRDLHKADRVTTSKFPTFAQTPTDHYSFDGVDDYVSNVPTLPDNYTVTAAVDRLSGGAPALEQYNDATLLDDLSTEGSFLGRLHSLAIHDTLLSPFQKLQDGYQHFYWLNRGVCYGLYQRLVYEEACQLIMFLGSQSVLFTDLSNNNVFGTPTLVTNNGIDGCQFLSSTSRITVSDSSGLRSDQGSIVVYGDFDTSATAGHLCDKGTGLELSTNGNQINFMGRTIAHTFAENEQIGVSYRTGFKPRFFVDGYYIGEGSGVVSPVDTGTDDFIIGNNNAANSPTPYSIKHMFFSDVPLTDDEVLGIWNDRRDLPQV